MSTVLLTGGTGFVGSHTVERLLANGFSVRCLLRSERNGLGWLQGTSAEIVRGDLTHPDHILPHLEGVDAVIHIAGVTKARRAAEYTRGNVGTTEALLTAVERCGTVKKFIYLSSLAAVGPSLDGTPLTETSPCRPLTAYGLSKLEAERSVQRLAVRTPWVILRPPAVYGPRDPDILEMYRWVLRGVHPVFGSPRKTASLVFAPELARAVETALTSPRAAGEVYFVSDPQIHLFGDLMRMIASLAGRRTFTVRLPAPLLYTMAALSEGAAQIIRRPALLNLGKARDLVQPHWVCDPAKFQEHTGFRTQVPTLEAIRITYDWYRSEGWL